MLKRILQILLPFVILFLGIIASRTLAGSAPPMKKKIIKEVLIPAKTTEISPTDVTTSFTTYGTVEGRDQASLIPQVTAKILSISENFRVGNSVKKGEVLLTLERTDLEVLYQDKLATVSEIESNIAAEEVLALQAREEWVASGRKLENATPFRLRQPQLKALSASLESAKISVTKALLDLDRTIIKAPYDGLVASRTANLGELASPQNSVGEIYALDKAEVRLSLSATQFAQATDLQNLGASDKVITTTLSSAENPDLKREAQIVRMNPVVDSQNQVRYVIAEFEEPFNSAKGALPIGTFVNATITGKTLTAIYQIPETAIINDTYIWIVVDDLLERRNVTTQANQEGTALCIIEGESATLKIVTRPLVSFKVGQKVAPEKNE